ncbi:hypothetical protein [Chitinimonas arctica]|nr:hypothetical protein [Chitinimonas arctica]
MVIAAIRVLILSLPLALLTACGGSGGGSEGARSLAGPAWP